MSLIINPQHMQAHITSEHLRWAQSVHKALTGGVDMGIPTGKDSAGVYNTFDTGNSSGVLIRVGANSSSEPIKWDGSSAASIAHKLGRQPIGFKVVDKDAAVDVFRTAVPTSTTIALKASNNTTNVTLYIF